MPPPKERRIGELLDLVELGAHHIGRFPAELWAARSSASRPGACGKAGPDDLRRDHLRPRPDHPGRDPQAPHVAADRRLLSLHHPRHRHGAGNRRRGGGDEPRQESCMATARGRCLHNHHRAAAHVELDLGHAETRRFSGDAGIRQSRCERGSVCLRPTNASRSMCASRKATSRMRQLSMRDKRRCSPASSPLPPTNPCPRPSARPLVLSGKIDETSVYPTVPSFFLFW